MEEASAITNALVELLGIGNAPMTAAQRVARAVPVLAAAGVTLVALKEALLRADLPWNARQAASLGIDVDQWRLALEVAGVPDSEDLHALLDSLHRSEAAAAMLRAGYTPSMEDGTLSWSR
jgi:hypothetical protein